MWIRLGASSGDLIIPGLRVKCRRSGVNLRTDRDRWNRKILDEAQLSQQFLEVPLVDSRFQQLSITCRLRSTKDWLRQRRMVSNKLRKQFLRIVLSVRSYKVDRVKILLDLRLRSVRDLVLHPKGMQKLFRQHQHKRIRPKFLIR